MAASLALVLIIAAVAAIAVQQRNALNPVSTAPTTPVVKPGLVTIETTPPGAEVVFEGQVRGTTPVKLSMPPGHHEVTLKRGADERVVPFDVSAGTELIQRIEFAAPATVSTTLARLSVTTDPPGARVLIDGEPRGVAPVTISEVSVGRHRVSVASAGGSAERTVTTEAGATMSVMFSLRGTPGVEAGWLTIVSPFEVKIVEKDDVVGTSAASKIMLPAGSHEIDLLAASVGYSTHRRVTIEQGKTTELRVDARAPVNANARPWAEVFVDGVSVGTTPIANLSLSLGSHQMVFRHPDLGERKQDIVVSAQGPNRVSVDLSK